MAGFKICRNKGFHITFENGVTVSVQFGPGNYCSNYDELFDDERLMEEGYESYDAEVAVFDSKGPQSLNKKYWLTPLFSVPGEREYSDVVQSQSPEDVLTWLKRAESLSREAIEEYYND